MTQLFFLARAGISVAIAEQAVIRLAAETSDTTTDFMIHSPVQTMNYSSLPA
jgi:hypothetical protein